ncbi:MAG: YgjV family protein [Turicibacter sp.]|nr:YgjV family protein [Turicibacter sp.]
MNTWFIIAQILGVVTMGFEFACYQIKDKRQYFLITGIASFFWMLMFVAMGLATSMDTQMSLVIAGTYSTVRNLVFWRIFKDDSPKAKKAGRIFLVLMMLIGISAGVVTVLNTPEQVRWIHALGLFTALTFVVGQYLPGDHWVRITVVFYALAVMLTQTPLNILEGEVRWNVMGLLIEATKIVSVLIFYGAKVYRGYRIKKLQQLKSVIAEEIARIDTMSEKIPVANVPGVKNVEKLVAKMMRYELLAIAQEKIKDVDSAQKEISGILEDLEVIRSFKTVLSKG